jgi:hypothetical protein
VLLGRVGCDCIGGRSLDGGGAERQRRAAPATKTNMDLLVMAALNAS